MISKSKCIHLDRSLFKQNCLEGHFVNNPVVPGVLILKILIEHIEQHEQVIVDQVVRSKFLSPFVPDNDLDLNYRLQENRVLYDCASIDKTVAKGTLIVSAKK